MAVAAELVEEELRHNEEFAGKCGRFWRLSQQTASRASEAAYVLLRARGAASPPPPMVPRSVVPPLLRCLEAESRRDLRDWVVLQDSARVAAFYKGVFHLLKEENERRRRLRQQQRQRQGDRGR